MFSLYQQNIRGKEDVVAGDKEPDVIGHDRFYRERARSSVRLKKRFSRRSNSSAEFSRSAVDAAMKRAAFCARHRSTSLERSPGGSFATRFFGRSSSLPRHEYSALKAAEVGFERHLLVKRIRDGAYSSCSKYLAGGERYELKAQLEAIGSRADKHWFIVRDASLGAERLLSLASLPPTCPIRPSPATKDALLALFRSLQHPYIHPVLDVDFWDSNAALVHPVNPSGSLRDLIYGSDWHEDWDRKYGSCRRGEGLPLREIQCLGRQILEGLLFLRDRDFPPFRHLHSGNVIVQNGVARLAALENPLLGMAPHPPAAPETPAFGYLLYEMTCGYELASPPSAAHFQLELEKLPKVAEVLSLVFRPEPTTTTLEEVVRCELFRGVELRELRGVAAGAGLKNRPPQEVAQLLEAVKRSPPVSRNDVVLVVESRRLEDILEEDNEETDPPAASASLERVTSHGGDVYRGKGDEGERCVCFGTFRDRAYIKMLQRDNQAPRAGP